MPDLPDHETDPHAGYSLPPPASTVELPTVYGVDDGVIAPLIDLPSEPYGIRFRMQRFYEKSFLLEMYIRAGRIPGPSIDIMRLATREESKLESGLAHELGRAAWRDARDLAGMPEADTFQS